MSEHLPPSSRRLRRMASDYEDSMSEARAEQLAARAMARAQTDQIRPRRRFAVVVAAASLMFVVIGLGYGSAKSLPGDPLYGVSRTYEHIAQLVGVVDPVEERLYEVIALAERGDRELAALAAGEALEELGRQRGLTVSISVTDTTTPTATTPTTPPTTPPASPDDEDAAPAPAPEDTTTTTVAPSVTVDADEQDAEEDPIKTLKLAAELLLERVRENGDPVDDAATDLAAAVSALADEDDTTTVAADDPDTTSSTSSTTSTTEPEGTESTSTTSTTTPDSTTTSSTTSTTVPGEGEGEGSGSGDDGPGPIIMPPEF